MPRVYGVQDADDKLSGWMSEDETETAPTGETAVLESVIRAADPPGTDGRIQSGGHWDGTTYTPPVGDEFYLPFDPTTDAGTVKVAAHSMMDRFDVVLGFMDRNANLWPAENITNAEEGIHWQWVNTARCCLNSTRTPANRIKICEESASFPSDVSSPVEYVDRMGGGTVIPTKDWFWINLAMDPLVRQDIMGAAQGFNNVANVEDEPTSIKKIGRAWIDDIPD